MFTSAILCLFPVTIASAMLFEKKLNLTNLHNPEIQHISKALELNNNRTAVIKPNGTR